MKRPFAILLSVFLLLLPAISTAQTVEDSREAEAKTLADNIIREARKHLGKHYVHGGKGPNVFDCSGFTSYVYGQFGISISPASKVQAGEGRKIKKDARYLQKGDILVFGGRKATGTPGHVAIYIGPDESGDGFNFIHAASKGIHISNINETYYKKRWIGVRRFIDNFNAADFPDEPEDYEEDQTEEEDLVFDESWHSESASMIALRADSTWVNLLPDGTAIEPYGEGDLILLLPDGHWMTIPLNSEEGIAYLKQRQDSENSRKRK